MGHQKSFFKPIRQKISTYRVDVTDPFSNSFSHTLFPAFTLRPSIENSLRQQSISMQVQNIYSGKKLKQFIAPNFDTTSFYLHPDVKYLLDDYTRFSTLEEVLREYVALADVRKREGNFHFELYDFASNLMFKNDPLVMLDGVPVFDFNKFMELDPLLLYKVEVFNKRYFLGASVFNGVLNWTSYKNDLAGFDPSAHATIIDYDGLQTEREFYAPRYETEEQRLTSQSLWIDEGAAAIKAMQPTLAGWWEALRTEANSNLQLLFQLGYLWVWEKVFGASEWALRASNIPWFAAGMMALVSIARENRLRVALLILGLSSPFLW